MSDRRIIAEIERRKRIQNEAEGYVSITTLKSMTWEGSLIDIQVLGVLEGNIISIEQVSPGLWLMRYKSD